MGSGEHPVVTLRTAMIEDTAGCPLSRWERDLDDDCQGCVECIPDEEL